MSRATNYVKVDLKKIEEVCKTRGINQADMGYALGHEASFISGVKSRGSMAKSDALLFKSIYGVDLEIKESVSKNGDSTKEPKLDYTRLNKMIAGAIDYNKLADVMTKVIDYDKLSDAVCRAMVKALEGDNKPKSFEKRTLV